MKYLFQEDIENALKTHDRLYLCGNLSGDNALDHIRTDSYEVGMSDYENYKLGDPHVHDRNTEYNYVLKGQIKVRRIDTGEVRCFREGDFFAVGPGEPCIAKYAPGTRILFSKVPGGNDKEPLELTEDLVRWGRQWDEDRPDDRNE